MSGPADGPTQEVPKGVTADAGVTALGI